MNLNVLVVLSLHVWINKMSALVCIFKKIYFDLRLASFQALVE